MECCICNKNLGFFDSYNKLKSFNWDIPYDKENLCVCGDCSIKLRRLIFVSNMEQSVCEEQKGRKHIKEYSDMIKSNEIEFLERIQGDWLKKKIIDQIKRADNVMCTYNDYDSILVKAFEIISTTNSKLPDNKIEFGIETFAKDNENLYYMEFGNQVVNNEELSKVDSVQEKRKIIQLLSKSIRQPVIIIPLNNILYYQEKGDISYSTSVSGGGVSSKGANIAGAMAGKLMFGNVGAIIGSQVGTGMTVEEIQSETIEHDNRYIVFRYIDNNGNTTENKFPYEYIEVFSSLIPEKEFSQVQLEKVADSPKEDINNSIPIEELKKLKELFDMGIITLDEFDAKKKQLLGI